MRCLLSLATRKEWQNSEEWLQNDNDDPGWQPRHCQHVLGAELEPVQDSDSDSEEDLVPQATITPQSGL